jgi:hypothetical protein
MLENTSPTVSELLTYPRATISQIAAYDILPPDSMRSRNLAASDSVRNLRKRAENAEDAAKERKITNSGKRLLDLINRNAEAAGSECAPGTPPAASARDENALLYLIHVPKAHTTENLETEFDDLPRRLARAAKAKARTNAMAEHLWATDQEVSEKLASCNTYRVIRHWLESGDCRLIAAKTCRQDKLCPVCANLRSGRNAKRYETKILTLLDQRPSYSEWMWTLTVKDGGDLEERLNHLLDAMRYLLKIRRNLRCGSTRNLWNDFGGVAAAVYSVEIIKGRNSGLWHPHVHIYALHDRKPITDGFRCPGLEQWWKRTTGDSFVIDCRPIDADQRGGAVLEVLKYATKFSSMSLEENVHAWRVASGRRLMGSVGELRGVPLVVDLLDEFSRDDGEFVDLAFRFDGFEYVKHEGEIL